jgi:hypothetical protein
MQSHGTMPLRSEEKADLTFSKNSVVAFLERYSLVLCLLLMGIACVRIIATYNALSLTADEPFHLACGIEYLSYHSITLDVENPPIAQAVEALGPYFGGLHLTGRENPFVEGAEMLTRSGNVDGMIFRLRLGTLPFFLLACGVVGSFNYHFFGKAAAVLAVALYTLLPNALADGGLATTDMALAASTGAAFLAAILWAEKPDWRRAIVMGFFIALAFLTKLTALGYVVCSLFFAGLAYWYTSAIGWRDLPLIARRYYKTFALAVATTIFFMWAAYWFSFRQILGHHISVPAPEFFEGIRVAIYYNRAGHMSYLFGHHQKSGWWYYFPVAISFKTPIAFLILVAVGGVVCYRRRAAIRYLLPIAFVVGILAPAMSGHIDIGIRHIAPAYLGFSIIAALGLLALLESSRFRLLCSSAALALVLWMVVSVGMQHPDYLAYFNAFAGKHPENILVDSNYDWGQDLKFLSRRLHQLHADHVTLGTVDGTTNNRYREEWYGVPHILDLDELTPSPGWTAVGDTFDKACRFDLCGHSHVQRPWYDQIAPTERVGPYSLYYVPPNGRNAPHP